MRKNWLLLTLLLTGLAGVSYADLKFFWLDRPTSRDNKFDPSSPNYVAPTPFGGGGGATMTPTQVNGSSTSTPTVTPVGATATPTQTTTPCASCHTAVVADFEEADNSVDLWGGAISTSSSGNAAPFTGAFASSISPNPWVSTSASTGGNPGNCGCVSGSVGEQASPWPWVSYQFNLGAVAGTDVDVASYAPNHGIQFDFKATVANVPYRIRVKQQDVTDSGFYGYTFTPTDTAWHTLTVYFPGYGGGQPEFAQPSWAVVEPFGTVMNGIEFIAVGSATAASSFGFCVDNVTFAVGPQPTDTPTTAPTPVGGWPVIYSSAVRTNGNYYGVTNSSAVGGTEAIGLSDTSAAGQGVAGGNSYVAITMSATGYPGPAAPNTGYGLSAVIDTGYDASANPITQNAGAYTALSISVRVPLSCIIPAIGIKVLQGGVAMGSITVSAQNYLIPAPSFMASGTWYTAVIPLSAFLGDNGQSGAFHAVLASGDLANFVGVVVTPLAGYDTNGNLALTEIDVDDVVLNNASPATSNGYSPLFCDFEHGTAANWGDYWSSFNDQDKPDFTCTWAADGPTTRVFPLCTNCPTGVGVNPITNPTGPVTSGAGGPATPCDFGRFAGHVSNSNPATGCTLNALGGNYSYMGMGVFFTPAHTGTDILSLIGSYFPANGNRPHGIQLDIKSGPTADAGQTYTMFITNDVYTCSGCEVGTDLAPTSSWTTVQIPFPANGTVLTTVSSASGAFAQPSWGASSGYYNSAPGTPTGYTWDASGGATDSLKHLLQLKFQADNRGKNVDLEVDNILFY